MTLIDLDHGCSPALLILVRIAGRRMFSATRATWATFRVLVRLIVLIVSSQELTAMYSNVLI
jgi:hypothetical protein